MVVDEASADTGATCQRGDAERLAGVEGGFQGGEYLAGLVHRVEPACRDEPVGVPCSGLLSHCRPAGVRPVRWWGRTPACSVRRCWCCLLYTSDAADDLTRVDLGGRRII